jgi:(S)-citramalyl-CoA lyase
MNKQDSVTGKTRSWLFTPATRPERFAKASQMGADVLIVDLEDSVSVSEKEGARAVLQHLLSGKGDVSDLPRLAVRINSPHTRFGHDDLGALATSARAPKFILVPKVESAEQVQSIAAFLRDAGRIIPVVPLIESVKGLRQADAISQASKSVYGLMFGAADYASDARVQPDSMTLQLARCQIAMACAMAGVKAIDAPCFAIHDADTLREDLTFARKNGYLAKAAIHPSHIETINQAFTPSTERIDWARRVLAVSEHGAGVVDGRMVDEAIAREARDVLSSL